MQSYINSEKAARIRERVHNRNHRQILFDKFCNEETHEKIAEKHKISVRTVSRIVKRYRDIIKE